MREDEVLINLHQLRVFRTVARHMSFSRAAEDMILSQPAVSMHIKHLEETIGMPLFEKVGRQIYLTDAGTQLLEYSQRVFNALQETREAMSALQGGNAGRLRVAADTTAGAYVVPEYLGIFRQKFPRVDISLDVTNRRTVIERLLAREIDLAVIGQFPREEELEATPFLINELVVIAWPEHKLAHRQKIPLNALAKESFLMREEGSGTRATTEQFFGESGIRVRIGMELASNSAIKQAVAHGLGIAVVPRRAIELELRTGQLVILDVQGFPRVRYWHVVQLRDRFLAPPAAHFKNLLLSHSHPALGSMQAGGPHQE
ncbi:DNA-binding transcriptional regulator, LysR family [Sulfobacillus thermosulfidooxidans DSM 9293]|uniref:DNA-binding transcriptional regulator, LysR family n=1 Tax=Sulfobacillus thermosulfidooxidans (strain DSM 9293 / VKM B-1269 / AT-1) TaxID=929705 RepID=A0A1W1WI13_SULTA|nr:LysR family transcriptional regulator [Sulfobacillus thermosulfidooxidans]SMC05895.1 DNA-binding transcriptional regulator, LysR family [Sulfobacillus thermosulfidooxidans DSM 9293]